MPDLLVRNVSKHYPTRDEPLVVLRDCSLELSAGDNVAILGPSGSGKSTLLHIIGTLDEPSGGQVELLGQSPFELSEPELADFRNDRIGFIFQEHHLLPQLSVFENVLLPALARGRPDVPTIDRARDLLDRVGLSQRLEHRPGELSGGERERVAVARALIHRPALLLADEPTGNLDRSNAQAVGELLIKLQRQEKTMLVVVTHSADLAAMMEQRLEIDDGTLQTQPSKRPV